MSLLTVKVIRQEIADTSVADNIARMRLTFTDDEITNAIVRAAKNYNAQPPMEYTVNQDAVPDNALFIEGTIAALYRVGLNRMRRNLVEFAAGNTDIPFTATQIKQFEIVVADAEKKVYQMTHDVKMHRQVNAAFGTIY